MSKYVFLFVLITLLDTCVFAQSDSLELHQRFDDLEQNILKQESRNRFFQRKILKLEINNKRLKFQVDSLVASINQSEHAIASLKQQLEQQKNDFKSQLSMTRKSANQSVLELDRALNKNTMYWIIAVLAVGVLSILAFIFLRRKVAYNQSSMIDSLTSTRRDLEQETIRLDEKLVGVMETQLKIIHEERKSESAVNNNGEQDHSLALKVADEIIRIEKNISQMDERTKGLKQLSKAVERIKDNFASNGYEMVDMLNKQYEEGMKVSVTFRIDPGMIGNQQKITRIIKPQVNYKGVMIQQAQIEVSQPD